MRKLSTDLPMIAAVIGYIIVHPACACDAVVLNAVTTDTLAFSPSPASVEQQTSKTARKARATQEAVKEITIRNVTKAPVVYTTTKPFDSAVKPTKKTLAVGAIDRYPGESAIDLTFERDGKEISYRLDPRRPYSFRHNNKGKLELYLGSHGRADAPDLAPWVPTPMPVVERMLEMAQVGRDDLLFDLGCGDGRIVIAAAKKFGTRGVGVDIDPQRIKESNIAAKKAMVERLIEFRLQDATKVDLSSATVLGLYLLTDSNELLRPKMEKQLKPGTRVVCHNYPVPGWKAVRTQTVRDKTGKEHRLYLYDR